MHERACVHMHARTHTHTNAHTQTRARTHTRVSGVLHSKPFSERRWEGISFFLFGYEDPACCMAPPKRESS